MLPKLNFEVVSKVCINCIHKSVCSFKSSALATEIEIDKIGISEPFKVRVSCEHHEIEKAVSRSW